MRVHASKRLSKEQWGELKERLFPGWDEEADGDFAQMARFLQEFVSYEDLLLVSTENNPLSGAYHDRNLA